MKKFILLPLLLGLALSSLAQTISSSFANDINNRFSLLEKNRVPYGILLDYGFDIVDATKYDGVLRSDNYISLGNFQDLYSTIVSSCTSTSVAGISLPKAKKNEWADLQISAQKSIKLSSNSASVILRGLLFNYSQFNPSALNQNKIQITSGKYDDKYINGVWQNPYETKTTFAMVAPINYLHTSNVSVRLKNTMWQSNATVNSIHINFGDGGGYKSLNNEAAANGTYSQDGSYTWTYRVQMSNGLYKYARQKIIVEFQANQIPPPNQGCGNPRESITAFKPYLGQVGSATLEIVYNTDRCNINRPLIVAEGLDTGLFGEADGLGDNSLGEFREEIRLSTSINLEEILLDEDINSYDIIYVNWDDGMDYIQRNAYVLEAVIDWVNANKVGNEENVILGQSMGGLIARYALRDMENNNEDHETSLYISHDAPHQGAHVPLGMLYLARHISDLFLYRPLNNLEIPLESGGNVSLLDVERLLDSPAVRQMLINYVDSNLNHTTTFNGTWQTELQNMGYPQQTRNISLSNASHCAEPQGLASNETLVDLNFEGSTSALVDLIVFFSFTGPLVGDYFDDTITFLLGFLPGKTTLEGDFTVKAFPASGTANIYTGSLTYEKTLLWLIPIQNTISTISKNSVGNLFLDNYPGGINPTGVGFVGSEYESGLLGTFDYSLSFNPNFGFIPAVSALDVGGGNTTLSDADYKMIYVASNPPTGPRVIPFDNFTTSSNINNTFNEPHISFNRRNGDWLADELINITTNLFDCSFICDDSEIIGPLVLCSTGTYSINVPAGTNVNWTISNTNVASITSQTNGSVTLSANSGSRADIVLTAVASSGDCGTSEPITFNIRVGKPDAPPTLSGPATVNTGAIVNYVGGVANGATSYEWRLPYPFTTASPLNYMSQDWQLEGPGNTRYARAVTGYTKKSGYVQVMGKNACGTGGAKLLYVQHATSGGGGKPGGGGIPKIDPSDDVMEVSLYPNPTKGKVTVNLTDLDEYDGNPPTVIYAIKVLDQNLYERKFYEFKDHLRNQELNVSYLNTGLNYIIVYTDSGTFTKKLMVY